MSLLSSSLTIQINHIICSVHVFPSPAIQLTSIRLLISCVSSLPRTKNNGTAIKSFWRFYYTQRSTLELRDSRNLPKTPETESGRNWNAAQNTTTYWLFRWRYISADGIFPLTVYFCWQYILLSLMGVRREERGSTPTCKSKMKSRNDWKCGYIVKLKQPVTCDLSDLVWKLKAGWWGKFFFGSSESECLKTYLSRIKVHTEQAM